MAPTQTSKPDFSTHPILRLCRILAVLALLLALVGAGLIGGGGWLAFADWRTARQQAAACSRSRIASVASSGTWIAVRSPDRRNRASFLASRRSVFTRLPACTGTSEGATTTHEIPRRFSSR